MKKNKTRGFTLVELLVTIGIIGIILTISTVSVYTIINNSKEKSNKLAINNIKKSTGIYIKEYKNEISWDDDNTTCIPIQTLISKGYVKKDILDKDDVPLSIILIKDEYNNIISEQEEYVDCNTYSKTVKIPTNDEICNNFTYNGTNYSLINPNLSKSNYSKIEYQDTSYSNENNIHPKNAGEYKLLVSLRLGKKWEDNTNDPKTVTCKILKKTPYLSLSSMGNSSTKIGTTKITLTSEISGTISVKSSNNNYVTAKINGDKNITALGSKEIEIDTIATRKSNTTVTITVTPTGEYANNYETGTIVYTVADIKNTTVAKPTCNDSLYYNGKEQTLITNNKAYDLINNTGINIGNYTITARLKYGYTWEDNTTTNVELTCEIKTPKPTITYKDATCNPSYINVTYNKKYGENQQLCTPTKDGYRFNGWYSDSNYTNQITDDTIVTNFNDHNLYAYWELKSYDITFDPNGGTVTPTSKSVEPEATYGELPTPEKACNEFLGWYTEKDGGDRITESDKVTALEEHTLFAHWSAKNFMILFDANDGVVSPQSKSVVCGKAYEGLPVATYTGHTFIGWYTARTGGSQITSSTIVSLTNNQTLYAHWTANNYQITFDANGGTVSTPSKTVTYGKTYETLPVPTRNNYVFIGWYTEKNGGTQIMSGTAVAITSAQTLYAHWTSASKTFNYTGTIETFTVPVSGTYKLEAWGAQGCYTAGYGKFNGDTSAATSAVGGKGGYSYGNATLRKGDIIYVVVGQSPSNGNGGYNGGGGGYETGGGGGATHIAKETGLLQDLSSKRSSIFIVAGGGGGNGRGAESNYSYNGGAGGGTSGSQTNSGQAYAGGSGGTQSSGYSFGKGANASTFCGGGGGGGWYGGNAGGNYNGGRPGGGGSGYIGGVTNGSTSSGVRSGHGAATITLVSAIVEDTSGYTITFNANGGSVTTTSKIVNNGENYGGMPIPTRLGYIFKGWYTQTSGGTQITSSTVVSLTSNQTLYAHWEVEPDTLVVYQANTSGSISINNAAYVNVPNYVISPGVWYRLGTDTKSTTININYGGYKSVEIEYTLDLNNCSIWWDGEKRAKVSIADNLIYDSTDQKTEGINPYYYTYKGSASSVVAVGTATNEESTVTWVEVNIYVTKITLKK